MNEPLTEKIVLTAASEVLVHTDDEARILKKDAALYLKDPKSRKYLGVQDQLAVVSAGLALRQANLDAAPPKERTGLYLAVGHIPFESADIDPVLEGSRGSDGEFCISRFSKEGYRNAHPLLAFRCLPNMPAFHIAANFNIQGPYSVGYPSAGEFYTELEQAVLALAQGEIDLAMLAGVAATRNFLVEHHFKRLCRTESLQLIDAAGTWVLEREASAQARGCSALAELTDLQLGYEPFDPLTEVPEETSDVAVGQQDTSELNTWLGGVQLGPAAAAIAVRRGLAAGAGTLVHHLKSSSGVVARAEFRGTP